MWRGGASGEWHGSPGWPRETVRKMLEYLTPSGYQRQKLVWRPKLGPWRAAIKFAVKPFMNPARGVAIRHRSPAELEFSFSASLRKQQHGDRSAGRVLIYRLIGASSQRQLSAGATAVKIASITCTLYATPN